MVYATRSTAAGRDSADQRDDRDGGRARSIVTGLPATLQIVNADATRHGRPMRW